MAGRIGKASLALILMFSMLLGSLSSVSAAADPDERINVALNKTVTSSSSYEQANEGWQRKNLVDGSKTGPNAPGLIANGWTTIPDNKQPAAGSPAWVIVDLGQEYQTEQIVLWPRSDNGVANIGAGFPVDFKVMVSVDGTQWQTVGSYQSYPKPVDGKSLVVDFTRTHARYVKVEATKLQGDDRGAIVMQLRELEVFMADSGLTDEEVVQTDYAALDLGQDQELLAVSVKLPTLGLNGSSITWSSSNPAVLNETGRVKRPAAGQEPVPVELKATIQKGSAIKEKEFQFTVKPHKERVETGEDEFQIGIFWPPTEEYMNDQQYQWIKEANVDVLQNVLGSGLDTEELNMKMLDLAERYGLKVNVADPRIRGTKAQIKEVVDTYKDYWATTGYYIRDEPGVGELDPQAEIYREVLKHDSIKNPYVNLLPNVYGENYERDYVRGWVKSVGKENLKYLSYDNYPFMADGSFTNNYYDTADIFRRVGLENNIKTASYLQSLGFGSAPGRLSHRTPSEADLRYSAYSYLAYGFKYVTWFTYWTPTGRGEHFEDAIIDPKGNKTVRYEPFKQINGEMKQLGKTLIKLDAMEVYHTGPVMPTAATKRLPNNFYLQPVNEKDEMIVSYMKHKETDQTYVMIVNKSLKDAHTFALKTEEALKDIREVSKETGLETAANFDRDSGILTANYAPGEGRLFLLEGDVIDYYGPQEPNVWSDTEPTPKYPLSNMALGSQVEASTDILNYGWNKKYLVDGKTIGELGDFGVKGWTSNPLKAQPASPEWVIIDLGKEIPVTQINLWPRNDKGTNVGLGFPSDYKVMLSSDKQQWETIVHETDAPQPTDGKVVTHTFDPVTARYIKVEASKLRPDPNKDFVFQLAEIEVFQAHSGTLLHVKLPKSDLLVGDTVKLDTKQWQNDGTLHSVANAAYTSDNTATATVDDQGNVQAQGIGTAHIQVVVEDEEAGTKDQTEITVNVRALDAPWQVAHLGSASSTIIPQSGQLELRVNGAGLGTTSHPADELLFIHQAVSGNKQELTVRLDNYSVPGATGALNGRSGLMYRQGLVDAAESVYLSVDPTGRLELRHQAADGSTINLIQGLYRRLPVELKLVHDGSQFTGYFKQNDTWFPITGSETQSSLTVEEQQEWQVGIATYSGIANANNRALFSGLSLVVDNSSAENQAAVEKDAAAIELGSINGIVSDLALPVAGTEGTVITWSSSDQVYLDNSGKLLKRPAVGEADAVVTLTATVTKGDASVQRSFKVTIKAQTANSGELDQAAVEKDAAAIKLGDLGGIVSDLSLPVAGAEGTAITWSSSDKTHLDNSGKLLKRPAVGEADAVVTLTATVTKGDASVQRSFKVTIKAQTANSGELDQAAVEKDAAAIKLGELDGVVSDLLLPAAGAEGTTITWSSSDKTYLDNSGKLLQRPASGNADVIVTLTATVTKGDAKVQKTFKVTIKAWPYSPWYPPVDNPNPGTNPPKPGKDEEGEGTTGGQEGSGEESAGSGTVGSGIVLTDIEGNWANAAIQRAVELGIVTGYADGTFKPSNLVSRAELAAMLVRALKLDSKTDNGQLPELSFTDNASIGSWAQAYIAQAVHSGIIKGYTDQTFRPQQMVSRTELTVMIARSLNLDVSENSTDILPFKDAEQIPAWARPYVAAAYKQGIVHGRDGQWFAPQEQATRAEAVVLLIRMLDRQ